MCTAAVPASAGEALRMLHASLATARSAAGFLAAKGVADLSTEAVAEGLRELECADAAGAAARGVLLAAFDAQDGPVGDGQRTVRTWLVNVTGVTKGQAGQYKALESLARDHPVLHAGLAGGHVITKSVALQVARWTRAIPEDYRDKAEEIIVAAAAAGADLRALAAICAEIRSNTAEADRDGGTGNDLDRGVCFDTTSRGPGCCAGT